VRKSTKRQPESVVFDRNPGKQKFQLDLDIGTHHAMQMGLSSADVIEMLLMQAESVCQMARERGDDLSRLEGMFQELAA
jgi:hypothetical protein